MNLSDSEAFQDQTKETLIISLQGNNITKKLCLWYIDCSEWTVVVS